METDSNWACLSAVPMEVRRVHLSNQGHVDSLQASWELPPGDLDYCSLELLHNNQAVQNHTVPANTTSLQLSDLRPGASYRLVVSTVSGGMVSKPAVAEGRTGKLNIRNSSSLCIYSNVSSTLRSTDRHASQAFVLGVVLYVLPGSLVHYGCKCVYVI